MDEVWAFQHSMECDITAEFAWRFWTEVRNWTLDTDVESVEIDGPFAAGTNGTTISKSSGRISWSIAAVAGMSAVIEAGAPGAVARFAWSFEDIDGRVRITQRASLAGEGASQYVTTMGRAFEDNMPAGMQKLCEAMRKAASGAA